MTILYSLYCLLFKTIKIDDFYTTDFDARAVGFTIAIDAALITYLILQ